MNNPNKNLSKRNLRLVSITLAFYLAFPLFLLLTGLGKLEWGARAYGPTPVTSLLFHLAVLIGGVFVILVSPMVNFVWKQVPGNYSASMAVIFTTVMTAMPIFAFGYYLGGIRTAADVQELSTAAFPAALFSTLVYERTRSAGMWVAVLTLTIFFPYYLFSEVLSGLNSYVSIVSSATSLPVWRALFPFLATTFLFVSRLAGRRISSGNPLINPQI